MLLAKIHSVLSVQAPWFLDVYIRKFIERETILRSTGKQGGLRLSVEYVHKKHFQYKILIEMLMPIFGS